MLSRVFPVALMLLGMTFSYVSLADDAKTKNDSNPQLPEGWVFNTAKSLDMKVHNEVMYANNDLDIKITSAEVYQDGDIPDAIDIVAKDTIERLKCNVVQEKKSEYYELACPNSLSMIFFKNDDVVSVASAVYSSDEGKHVALKFIHTNIIKK